MHKNATGQPAGTALPRQTRNAPSTLARWLCRALRRAMDVLMLWRERNRQRRVLATLNDDLLKDIGVSRPAAHYESIKRPWRD